MKHLYKRGVNFIPDVEVDHIELDGNRKKVIFRNTLTGLSSQQIVDHVVVENGSRTTDELYFELVDHSRNAGQINLKQFAKAQMVFPNINKSANLNLVRLGDAITSRNLHAALFDANRLVHGFAEVDGIY